MTETIFTKGVHKPIPRTTYPYVKGIRLADHLKRICLKKTTSFLGLVVLFFLRSIIKLQVPPRQIHHL
jgi:hypothetical protein